MFCTASDFSNSKCSYFHGSNLSKNALHKMSKGKIGVLGVNRRYGIRGQSPWR